MKKQFFRFAIAGGISFVFDYGMLYILTEYFNLNYLWASAYSFIISVVINYVLCVKFVFAGAKNGMKQIVLFGITSTLGLALNQLCMWFFVECVFLHYMLAKIFSTVIVTLWNYITKKLALEN